MIDAVGDLRESFDDYARTRVTSDDMRKAVALGMREVLSDPAIWGGVVSGMRRAAQQEAGGWLFGGLRAFFSRLMWVALAVMVVYMLGGWSAVWVMFKGAATT